MEIMPKNLIFFPILGEGGGGAPGAPPLYPPLGLSNIGMSEQWSIGTMDCRYIGVSEKWGVELEILDPPLNPSFQVIRYELISESVNL
jgi:hypothetical protein